MLDKVMFDSVCGELLFKMMVGHGQSMVFVDKPYSFKKDLTI